MEIVPVEAVGEGVGALHQLVHVDLYDLQVQTVLYYLK